MLFQNSISIVQQLMHIYNTTVHCWGSDSEETSTCATRAVRSVYNGGYTCLEGGYMCLQGWLEVFVCLTCYWTSIVTVEYLKRTCRYNKHVFCHARKSILYNNVETWHMARLILVYTFLEFITLCALQNIGCFSFGF